jgi:hypothetical protein
MSSSGRKDIMVGYTDSSYGSKFDSVNWKDTIKEVGNGEKSSDTQIQPLRDGGICKK